MKYTYNNFHILSVLKYRFSSMIQKQSVRFLYLIGYFIS